METAPEFSLSVPSLFDRTISYLSALKDEDFESLLKAFEGLPPESSTEKVLDDLVVVLPEGEGRSVTALLEFVTKTRRLVGTLRSDIDTIAAAVVRASQRIDLIDTSKLEERLTALLSSEFVAVREKAEALASESELVLTDARCITDLRPVFATDGTLKRLEGFVIIQSLKLETFGKSGAPIYLTLDQDGLEQLIDAVERAREKANVLDQQLRTAGWRNLTVKSKS